MSDTISTLAAKLRPHWLRDVANVTVSASGGAVGVTDHGALTGLFDDHHPGYLTAVRGDARYITSTRQVIAGAGLTGGGDLSADRTFTVGAGLGLTVNVDNVALTTPGTLTVSSSNAASGSHTHAITSSSNPGAAAAILASSAAGLLTLQNGAFVQAAQSNATFASGFAGSGWRVDYGVTTASKASLEVDDLVVRGRMRIYELLIQQIRATNGSLFVSSASKITAITATNVNPAWNVNGVRLTLNGSNATFVATTYTIETSTLAEHNAGTRNYHGFLYGDIIRAQRVEWNGSAFAGVMQSNLEVTGVVDLYTYIAAHVSGDSPAVGHDFVRLGNFYDTTRQGSVYITSDDSAAPFIDIVDGVSSHTTWNSAGVVRVRVGKLTGVSDSNFGGPLAGYGLYGNNVYLRGQIVVTGGSLGGLAAADVNSNSTTINGGCITTNSITAAQIAANTITAAKIAASTITANEIAANTITAAKIAASTITANEIAANTITGNKLSLTTTIGINSTTFGANGIQLDYNSGTPRFYAGNGSSSFLQYNGTNVSMTGFITATGGSFTGGVYCGSNAVRFSTDGQRLVLPNLGAPNLKTTIPSNSSAMRWFVGIDDTWTNAANYTGMIGYRDTTNKVVDFVQMSYVGSTDYSTYYARSMLYANRYNGSTDKECRLEATVDPGTGGAYVTATCDTMYTSNNLYVTNNMSALSITDRTPHYEGDALAELRQIRGKTRTVKGRQVKEIDHATLPAFARVKLDNGDGKQPEEGRDLGAMISMFTVAIQQIATRLDALEGRGNGNRQ